MDHQSAIRAYYDAFRSRDRGSLEDVLKPDMNHRSPFGSYDDRGEMLDAIWPSVGSVWAVELEIFGEGPGYMVRYSHNVDPASTHAEYIRFDGDRIAEIEVYLSKFPQSSPLGDFAARQSSSGSQ